MNTDSLRQELEGLETFRFHPAGCHATYPHGMCDCYHKDDLDRIEAMVATKVQEARIDQKLRTQRDLRTYIGSARLKGQKRDLAVQTLDLWIANSEAELQAHKDTGAET